VTLPKFVVDTGERVSKVAVFLIEVLLISDLIVDEDDIAFWAAIAFVWGYIHQFASHTKLTKAYA